MAWYTFAQKPADRSDFAHLPFQPRERDLAQPASRSVRPGYGHHFTSAGIHPEPQITQAPGPKVARDDDPDSKQPPASEQKDSNWFYDACDKVNNNPYWSTVTNNAVSTGTTIAEEGANSAAGFMGRPKPGPSILPPEPPVGPSAAAATGLENLPEENWDPVPPPTGTEDFSPITDQKNWDPILRPDEPNATLEGTGATASAEPPATAPGTESVPNAESPSVELPADSTGATPWDFERGANSAAEDALQTGSRWAGASRVFGAANKVLNPLGVVSNTASLIHDVRNGNYADAFADTAGLTGAGIGTAATASELGLIGALPAVAAPVGAAAGAFAGGYAGGQYALGKANDYAKNNNIFGEDRDSTEAAGDSGRWVRDKLQATWLPNCFGSVAGGAAAIGSSWGTALYSGGHAAVSGIASLFSSDEKVDEEGVNQMTESIGDSLDQSDREEMDGELYGGGGTSAREEMPPPAPEEK